MFEDGRREIEQVDGMKTSVTRCRRRRLPLPLRNRDFTLFHPFLTTPTPRARYPSAMIRMTIVLLAMMNFALFGIALRVLFARERRTPLVTRLMVGVGLVVSYLHVYVLATAPLSARAAATGAGIYVLAGGLFSWAAQSVRGRGFRLAYVPGPPNVVFSGGPYRWLRHPLYLSYTLAWIAGAVAALSIPLLFTVAAMVAFYVGAAYREERQILRSASGDDYRAYRRQAGVLLPKFQFPGW